MSLKGAPQGLPLPIGNDITTILFQGEAFIPLGQILRIEQVEEA
jgi:hypothetical protein